MAHTLETASRLIDQGEPAKARALLEKALAAEPGDGPARFLLGLIKVGEGRTGEGLEDAERAAETFRPGARMCHRLGKALFEQGAQQAAAEWLRRAVEQAPELAASRYWLGNALRSLGRPKEAEIELKQAIRLEPAAARSHVALAYLYREGCRMREAAEAILEVARLSKGDPEAAGRVAGFLAEIRRYDLAEKVLSRVLPSESSNPAFLARLGQLRQKVGLFDEAAQCFRRAIVKNPNADAAYLGLAVVKKYQSLEDPDAVVIRRALEADGLSDESKACAHFALGKILDDTGEYGEAFGHIELANRIKAAQTPYSVTRTRQLFEKLKAAFTPGLFERIPRPAAGPPTPVFIVGQLRSGTSLVERILDAHPDIFGAGELNFVEALAEGLSGEGAAGGEYPENLSLLPPAVMAEAAGYYRATLKGYAQGEPYVVDKNPLNFIHLGLIAALFPGARVIHCRRHPLDTALSIYFQHFAHAANAYAYDLKSIGEFYQEYLGLMAHWYQALPLDIFDLDYDELVKAPEKHVRRMLDYIGAPFDEKCLEFHKHEGAVATASLWQARQPLYATSSGRWKNYREGLSPLIETFRKANIIEI